MATAIAIQKALMEVDERNSRRPLQYSLRALVLLLILGPLGLALWPWWVTDIGQHIALAVWTCAITRQCFFGVRVYRRRCNSASSATKVLEWCVHGPAIVGLVVWLMTVLWLCGPELMRRQHGVPSELGEFLINVLERLTK